jgi:hypothetical protein
LTLFVLDIGLLCVIAALTMTIGAWLIRSSFLTHPGIEIALTAPNIRAGDVVPVRLDMRVADGRRHEDVRVTWNLPSWVEIVRAEPALSKNDELYVGSLASQETLSAYVLVRVKAEPGTEVPFSVTVHQFDSIGLYRHLLGSAVRRVEASAVTIEPLMDIHRVTAKASVPFRVRNVSDATIPAVTVRLTGEEGFPNAHIDPQETSLVLGAFSAHEERIVFVDLDRPSATSSGMITLEVEDGGYVVSRLTTQFRIEPTTAFQISAESSDPREGVAMVHYADMPEQASVAVIHPLMTSETGGAVSMYALSRSAGTITIPLRQDVATKSLEWSVLPVFKDAQGEMILGERSVGLVNQSFPVASMVRYTTLAGDQIGVGPLPPRVGETTTYWIVWTIGPGSFTARQVSLAATLGPQVRATGAFSTSIPSAFSTDGKNITWNVTELALASAQTVTVAFEVSLTPTRDMRGKAAVLLNGGTATAIDTQTGARLSTRLREQTTDASQDLQLQDKGIVE